MYKSYPVDRINTQVIYRLAVPDNFVNKTRRQCHSLLAGQSHREYFFDNKQTIKKRLNSTFQIRIILIAFYHCILVLWCQATDFSNYPRSCDDLKKKVFNSQTTRIKENSQLSPDGSSLHQLINESFKSVSSM